MRKIFHIFTIANDLSQYEEMKSSFIEAGFREDLCKYSLFDNSQGNIHDPYKTFNWISESTDEPYIIFCHQDIILNQGHGFNHLLEKLQDLESKDPSWAVAGNAGVNNNYQYVLKITDPHQAVNWSGSFPQQVHSLDENFLVIKSSANISCSKALEGFHFYATDMCLNSITKGYSCYVIDFHLTHLSGGNLSEAFWVSESQMYQQWHDKFNFCYVKTSTGVVMCFSKYSILRTIGSQRRAREWLLSRRVLHNFIVPKN